MPTFQVFRNAQIMIAGIELAHQFLKKKMKRRSKKQCRPAFETLDAVARHVAPTLTSRDSPPLSQLSTPIPEELGHQVNLTDNFSILTTL